MTSPRSANPTDPPESTPSTDGSTEAASATDHSSATDSAGDRYMSPGDVADVYADKADAVARLSFVDRLFTGRYRRRQFGDAEGRVLDVACGTGTNFRYLPASVDLVGIDVSPDMLRQARDELDDLGRDGTLHEMDAQDLAFDDDSFDTVISSLSTCTFPDPVAALSEMGRVCKPDGRILLLEHGRSGVGPIDRVLDWRADAHYASMGCRWNQEPLDHVRAAGLPVGETWSAFFGIITGIEAEPA